jgi:hypothetical protein
MTMTMTVMMVAAVMMVVAVMMMNQILLKMQSNDTFRKYNSDNNNNSNSNNNVNDDDNDDDNVRKIGKDQTLYTKPTAKNDKRRVVPKHDNELRDLILKRFHDQSNHREYHKT